jgi:hypothetical protein
MARDLYWWPRFLIMVLTVPAGFALIAFLLYLFA